MRIISGIAGSLPIKVPQTLTRPTTDRVREAIFSSLGNRVVDARVLDLFAGSGALGLEALSRGAAHVDFVDAHPGAAETIGRNLESTRLKGGKVWKRDAFSFLSQSPSSLYDLVFADPPYVTDEESSDLLETLLTSISLPALLGPDGIFVLETSASLSLLEEASWRLLREKCYGRTCISYLEPAT